jgi:hypothetical protein
VSKKQSSLTILADFETLARRRLMAIQERIRKLREANSGGAEPVAVEPPQQVEVTR